MLVSAVQHDGSFILVCVCVYTFFFRWAHYWTRRTCCVRFRVLYCPGLSPQPSWERMVERPRCRCRGPAQPDSESLRSRHFMVFGCGSRGSQDGGAAVSLTVSTSCQPPLPALGGMLAPQGSALSPSWAASGLLCRESRGWSHGTAPGVSLPAPRPLTWKGGRKRGVGRVGG